jgi:hypothetical protein
MVWPGAVNAVAAVTTVQDNTSSEDAYMPLAAEVPRLAAVGKGPRRISSRLNGASDMWLYSTKSSWRRPLTDFRTEGRSVWAGLAMYT